MTGDEDTGSPKVSYAELREYNGREFILGAGFYYNKDHPPEITLSVDPESLTEGGSAHIVTVTATVVGDPVPVTTRLSLSRSGTAISDDYSVSGNLDSPYCTMPKWARRS